MEEGGGIKRMLKVNCYKCKHFKPERDPKVRNRPPYVVGYCHFPGIKLRVLLVDESIRWISKRGCDGFELRDDLKHEGA